MAKDPIFEYRNLRIFCWLALNLLTLFDYEGRGINFKEALK
jgi:hypothetical protein